MNINFSGRILVCIILSAIFIGCSRKYPEIKWSYSDKDVIGPAIQKADRIDLDIYVDATSSMDGYVKKTPTPYSSFIDQLEASALSAWKEADTKFFKFGQTIKQIDRNEFLSAKNDRMFYHQKGICEKTYIDSVVSRTNTKRLSVLITDLFQNEGDVNIMVERIKEKCFKKEVYVGILGMRSDFKGIVCDVPIYPNGFPIDSKDRPFYAVIFGNPGNMELLFQSFKGKPFIKENEFLIFSPYVIKSYDVTITKESKFLVNKESGDGIKSPKNFIWKTDGKEGCFKLEMIIQKNEMCPNFIGKNLEIVAFKKSATDESKNLKIDSTLTEDVAIENIKFIGNKLSAKLIIRNEDEAGNYSYLIFLKANQLNGLETPDWIKYISTDNPVKSTPSESKTYNLEKFVNTLLVANASISSTYIAKFYINIYKR